MNTVWFLDRSSGFVLLVLFTISLTLGVLATRRTGRGSMSRLLSQDLHVRVTSAALALLVVHVATAVADTYVDISLADVLLPFRGGYRPFWLGLGTISLDLFLLVLLTTFIRGKLNERAWRIFHALSYIGWLSCLFHAWGTGTDARTNWGLALIVSCTLVGLIATAWRIYVVMTGRNSPTPPRVAGHSAQKGEVFLS